VGLVAVHLDASDAERFGRLSDQRELRDEIVGRRRAMRLVVGVDLVAEIGALGIEDDGEMRRTFGALGVTHQLEEHVAEAGDGAGAGGRSSSLSGGSPGSLASA